MSNVHRWLLVCIVTLDQHYSTPLAIVAASDFLSSKTVFQHVGDSIMRVG